MRRTSVTGSRKRYLELEQRSSGFTLLELMVVIAILALMTLAIPLSINRMLPARRVVAAAARVSGMVRDAQAQSSATGRPIQIKAAKNILTLVNAGGEVEKSRRSSVFAAPQTTLFRTASLDGRAAPGLAVFPDGSTSGGYIDVVDGGHRARVSISVLTGRTTVKRDN